MQGIKEGQRLEVNCIGRGTYFECQDSSGRTWESKERLIYNEVFDSSEIGGDGKDWTPTIQSDSFSTMGTTPVPPEHARSYYRE